MSVKNVVMFFGFLQFLVERSKEFSLPRKAVAGPLAGEREDEWALIPLLFFGVGAPNFALGQRVTLRKSERFDNTMGFPGEDVQIF